MPTEDEIRRSFLSQAEACGQLGSPFTATLCRLMATRLNLETDVGTRVLNWNGEPGSNGDALPLRLAGALRALVLSGSDPALIACYPPATASDDALWSACEIAFVQHRDFILHRLRSAPQTNEVRRSGALLPGFLTIAKLFGKPLVLSEVGASAGLNLQWDRYAYRLGDLSWSNSASVVEIAPQWTGAAPPAVDIKIRERAGCDLNPLDPSSADDRLRLLSYIWANQADRIARTQAALEIAVDNKLSVERADAIDWLKTRLATPFAGATHVIYHSIAWQYLPQTLQAAGEKLIAEAGARATADAPIARLQMEAKSGTQGAAITLQVWPSADIHQIGRADFHGRWVDWSGWPDQQSATANAAS